MKKILSLILLVLCFALALVACGDETPAETTVTTTSGTVVTTPVATTTKTPENTTPVTTAAVTADTTGKQIVTEDYTATINEFEWVSTDEVDYSKFDYSGTGSKVASSLTADYNGWSKTWYLVGKDGTKTEVSSSVVRKLRTVGVTVKADEAAKTAEFEFVELISKVEPAWSKVTARAGSYLMFEFTTNMAGKYYMTVTSKEGGAASTAAYKQDGIEVKGENGKYTGIAKCTVPYQSGKTFYINICLDDGATYPIAASIPVTITPMKYESEFQLMFQGDWELVKREDYLSDLVDLFYNVYPRLYARFGEGDPKVPRVITFMADKNYDGVAYCAGTLVCVSTTYANKSPYDIGFFAHEITHSVQQYGGKLTYNQTNTYKDPETGKTISVACWWTENMANLGRFRYFEWGYSTKFIVMLDVQKNSALWDWGYSSYADGGKAFLTYLDWKYPSRDANKDGKLEPSEYGVIDLINYTIKNTKTLISDHPFDPNTDFNKAVKQVTGLDCMEDVRLQYVEECKNGTFVINGFKYFEDNWITEGLPNIPDPEYPQLEPVAKGDKTAPMLEAPVTEGANIAKGATIVSTSSQGSSKYAVANLLDGDLSTMWLGAKVTDDYKYELGGYKHELVIDLGEAKKFDTYTLVNHGSKSNNKNNNTSEWELFVSDDGKTWTSVDYQKDNTKDIASMNVGDVTARYVKLRVHTTDQGVNAGTVRLYEFMLFDQQ